MTHLPATNLSRKSGGKANSISLRQNAQSHADIDPRSKKAPPIYMRRRLVVVIG
jgi:hypothetical protein